MFWPSGILYRVRRGLVSVPSCRPVYPALLTGRPSGILFLAALTSLGTFELAAFSFSSSSSSVFPPCNSTSNIINMVASIDRKLSWKNKAKVEEDDEVMLLVSAWDNLLLNNEDFLKKVGMNKSDVPNAPHLENCEEKARVRKRLDTRIANQTIPSWINGGEEENYPLTRRVQRDIWIHQHPLNCENKNLKFLVADWETLPGFGIGAQIAGMTGLLAIATAIPLPFLFLHW